MKAVGSGSVAARLRPLGRLCLLAMLTLGLASTLSACGRKGPVERPSLTDTR